MLPEARILNACMNHIKKYPRAHCRKVHGGPHGQAGEPDIDACIDGRSCKFEIKAPGRRPTSLQMAALRKWEAAGALAGWADSLDVLKDILSHLDEPDWVNPQLVKRHGEE